MTLGRRLPSAAAVKWDPSQRRPGVVPEAARRLLSEPSARGRHADRQTPPIAMVHLNLTAPWGAGQVSPERTHHDPRSH